MASDRDIAFPKLSAEQIDALRSRGRVRHVNEGEVLIREGDRDYDFFVVLSGAIEIVEHSGGEPHTVAVHEPGEFTGDVDMLTGRGALVTGRTQRSGEVLQLDPQELRRMIGELPEISEMLLKAFLMRRTLLLSDGFTGLRIIGSRFSPSAHHLRDFCSRNAIPFTWIDLEEDERAEALLREFGVPASATPVVVGRDGRWVSNPSVADLARYVGLDARVDADAVLDLVVVGAGPGGLAAAVYAASEGLTTLTLDAVAAGGQAGTSSRIENYLGFPAGITGAELTHNAMLQAQKFGARISVPQRAGRLRIDGGRRVIVLEDGTEVAARTVLIASGIEYRRPDIPGLAAFEGAGVYYAATDMEARLCAGDEVIVLGGGNSAGQAVVALARQSRKVHVVLRGDDLANSMSRYLVDRVQSIENVEVHHRHTVVGLGGNGALQSVQLRDETGGTKKTIPARALFIFIGAVPHTDWLGDCVKLDRRGFVLTGVSLPQDSLDNDVWRRTGRAPYFLETSLPGVFAAGDVRSGSVKRVASAVGEGAMAVSFVHAYLAATAGAA
jgi:thioredoxin reductase (NADPH)